MEIRLRLTVQFAVVVFFFLLFSFGAIYFFTQRYNLEQFHQRLNDKGITSATLLFRIDEVDSSLLKVIDRAKHDVLFSENITIYDSANREMYTNNDTVQFMLSGKELDVIRRLGSNYFRHGDFEVSGFLFRDKHAEYLVVAGAIDINGDLLLRNLRVLLSVLLVVSMVFVIAAGWVYAGRALKPINSLIDEIQSISEQDLHQRLGERKHNDEIGKLIRIFNNLLMRIDKAFDLQRAFVSNVSHELKNPLTRITSQLEVTLLNERGVEEYKETIKSVLDDARELNMLSTSLLDLASLHEDNKTFALTRVRIDQVLWEAADKVRSMNSAYITDFSQVDLPDNEEMLLVYGNPHLLRTSLINIIENACKFSFDNTARVSLFCSDQKIHIGIKDHGPGIEESHLQKIFQPFYRADKTSKVKGYGIGLSLSHRIFRIYDGAIALTSKVGVGTEVLVTLKSIGSF